MHDPQASQQASTSERGVMCVQSVTGCNHRLKFCLPLRIEGHFPEEQFVSHHTKGPQINTLVILKPTSGRFLLLCLQTPAGRTMAVPVPVPVAAAIPMPLPS
jgi:hypothetical protein